MVRLVKQSSRYARTSFVRAYQHGGDPTGMVSVAIGEAFRGREDSVRTTAKAPDDVIDRPMEGNSPAPSLPDLSSVIPAISTAAVAAVRFVGGGWKAKAINVALAVRDYLIADTVSKVVNDALKETGADAPEAETDEKKKKKK